MDLLAGQVQNVSIFIMQASHIMLGTFSPMRLVELGLAWSSQLIVCYQYFVLHILTQYYYMLPVYLQFQLT